MATRLFLARASPRSFLPLCTGVGLASAMVYAQQSRIPTMPLRCDAPPPPLPPHVRSSSGRPLNPQILRQITTGSIAGLLGGLAVSVFSKPLAVLIGLLIVGVQTIESYGIRVIPYKRLHKTFSNLRIQSLLENRPAFKVALGVTFALAGFAEF